MSVWFVMVHQKEVDCMGTSSHAHGTAAAFVDYRLCLAIGLDAGFSMTVCFKTSTETRWIAEGSIAGLRLGAMRDLV